MFLTFKARIMPGFNRLSAGNKNEHMVRDGKLMKSLNYISFFKKCNFVVFCRILTYAEYTSPWKADRYEPKYNLIFVKECFNIFLKTYFLKFSLCQPYFYSFAGQTLFFSFQRVRVTFSFFLVQIV